MTSFEVWLLTVISKRIPLDHASQAEIRETARERATNRSPIFRGRELASLLGLNLRLRGQHATGDNQREIFTQAAALGSVLVLFGTFAWMHASAPSLPAFALGFSAVMVAGSSIVDNRRLSAALKLACGVGWLLSADVAASITAGLVIGISLTVIGLGSRRSARHPIAGLVLIAAVGLYFAWGQTGGPESLELGLVTATAAAGPLFLLAIGWFDPRYAIAATAIWFWRLTTVDVIGLVSDANQLGTDTELTLLTARWLLMGAGVVVGTAVSQHSLARASAL